MLIGLLGQREVEGETLEDKSGERKLAKCYLHGGFVNELTITRAITAAQGD